MPTYVRTKLCMYVCMYYNYIMYLYQAWAEVYL